MQSLSPRLDKCLAKVEVLRLLFVCLHDMDFETRKHAITVAGRLARHNPAYVLPTLRQVLINLLAGLEFRDHLQTELESSILIGHLIRCAPQVVQPYVPAIMATLLAKLKNTDFSVSLHALEAIGEIADVANALLRPHLPTLIPIIVDMLGDQLSASKRETALRVLGQLGRGTGYVITAFEEYPKLIEAIFSWAKLRPSTWRPAAPLGFSVHSTLTAPRTVCSKPRTSTTSAVQAVARATTTTTATVPRLPTANRIRPVARLRQLALDAHTHPVGTEEYFQDLAIRELLAVAYNPALSDMHDYLIRSMGIICVKSGLKVVPYLPQLIPALIHLLKTCGAGKRTSVFKELGACVKVFTSHLRPYLDGIMDVIVNFRLPSGEKNGRATSASLHTAVMNLLQSAVEGLGCEMKNYVPKLLRHFMSVFSEDDLEDR